LDIQIGEMLVANNASNTQQVSDIEEQLKVLLMRIQHYLLSGNDTKEKEGSNSPVLVQQLIGDIFIAIYTVRQLG
jgi:hypothetical protein